MGEAPKLLYVNGFPKYGHDEIDNHLTDKYDHDIPWYEEVIDDDLKWSFALNRFIIPFDIHYYSHNTTHKSIIFEKKI